MKKITRIYFLKKAKDEELKRLIEKNKDINVCLNFYKEIENYLKNYRELPSYIEVAYKIKLKQLYEN